MDLSAGSVGSSWQRFAYTAFNYSIDWPMVMRMSVCRHTWSLLDPQVRGLSSRRRIQDWLLCESDKQRTSGGGWNWFKEILGVARLQHIGLYPPSLVGEGDRNYMSFLNFNQTLFPYSSQDERPIGSI